MPSPTLFGNLRPSRSRRATTKCRRARVVDRAVGAPLAGEGQQTKTEFVYQSLTGPRFGHRIEAVSFSEMQADLDRERKTMMRLWAKREEQIWAVVESTAGLCCDLQGIAGPSSLKIKGLELPLLVGHVTNDAAE
jgi:hypothetical protein